MRFVKEPPPSQAGKYKRTPPAEHVKWAKAMQRRPLEWMIVRECTSVQAAARLADAIKSSRYLAFRDGVYEARIGKHGDHTDPGQRAVYARYMGEQG